MVSVKGKRLRLKETLAKLQNTLPLAQHACFTKNREPYLPGFYLQMCWLRFPVVIEICDFSVFHTISAVLIDITLLS